MRIENIRLKNYRQFKAVETSFDRKPSGDLHVIIGRNGTGKTNVLNAINWCLYGDEHHLSGDSSKLPLLNLKVMEEVEEGTAQVEVEICVRIEGDQYVVFTRTATFQIHKGQKMPSARGMELEVKLINSSGKGNTEIFADDKARDYVQRFVPEGIREFFFFDGEILDSYFKESSAQNVRHAIFEISQIDLLERIEGRLQDVVRGLRRQAAKADPEVEEVNEQLEHTEQNLEELRQQIDECHKQIAIAKDKQKGFAGKLSGVPDVEALEQERRQLKVTRKHKEQIRSEKERQKEDLLFEGGIAIMLHAPIAQATRMIEIRKQRGEIPPTVDDRLLEETLRKNVCTVCGRPLDDYIQERILALLSEVKMSGSIARQLGEMQGALRGFPDTAAQFPEAIRRITHEVEVLNRDFRDIEERKSEIDRQLSGYDYDRIGEWSESRRKWESLLEDNIGNLALLRAREQGLEGRLKELSAHLNLEIKKEEKNRTLSMQMDFCSRALRIAQETKEGIVKDTRNSIEEETNRLFFELLWKERSFEEVRINNDYSISLIHRKGYECLGTVSAAERQLLALSFTLALHKVSGFDSPILIDTPVARISDLHRSNLGKVFASVGRNKQTILLLTPAEYSEEISINLDPMSSSKHELRLVRDESETRLEKL